MMTSAAESRVLPTQSTPYEKRSESIKCLQCASLCAVIRCMKIRSNRMQTSRRTGESTRPAKGTTNGTVRTWGVDGQRQDWKEGGGPKIWHLKPLIPPATGSRSAGGDWLRGRIHLRVLARDGLTKTGWERWRTQVLFAPPPGRGGLAILVRPGSHSKVDGFVPRTHLVDW